MSIKIDRLNSIFVKEISYILQNEVKDDNIKFVTVTGCEITQDLSFAKIYVTVFDESKKSITMKSLEKAKGFIRGALSKRVDVRHTPELRFIFDESIEYGTKIEKIINDIHKNDKQLRFVTIFQVNAKNENIIVNIFHFAKNGFCEIKK